MKLSCALPASLLIASLSSPALAQEQDAQKRLDPVVTTAVPGAAALSDIPMSVSVIGTDDLKLANAYLGAEDITDLLTGVDAAVANGTQVAFQIRGIGAVDHQALTPGAAAVYADGVYLATNVQTGLMLYDLEQIEVLKGPQGTLYGRNASGGAINFVTVRPDEGQSRYLSAGYGNFNRVDLGGAYGESLGGGFSYHLAGRAMTALISATTRSPWKAQARRTPIMRSTACRPITRATLADGRCPR